MMKLTRGRWLCFAGVTMIILLCYCPYLFFYFPVIFAVLPIPATVMLGALTFHSGVVGWALFYAVFSEPGVVSSSTDLEAIEVEALKVESRAVRKRLDEAKARGGKVDIDLIYREQLPKRSYCFACKTVRPVRAHHCKICQRCVLRMDHHCPWTGNCIGLYNHAHFLRFLFHAGLAMVFHYFLAAVFFFPFERRLESPLRWWIIAANISWTVGSGMAISYLFLYQWRNSLLNLTTIEERIPGVRLSPPFAKVTMRENLEQIFGKDYTLTTLVVPGQSVKLAEPSCRAEKGSFRV